MGSFFVVAVKYNFLPSDNEVWKYGLCAYVLQPEDCLSIFVKNLSTGKDFKTIKVTTINKVRQLFVTN